MCLFLALFILIQQGKGDMGLSGALGGSGQMLFGGSGGQSFFEKATWTMGVIFIFGSLALSIAKSNITHESELADYAAPKTIVETKQIPATNLPAQQQTPKSEEMDQAATAEKPINDEAKSQDNNQEL